MDSRPKCKDQPFSRNWKLILCKHFKSGKCCHGDDCQWAHSRQQQRDAREWHSKHPKMKSAAEKTSRIFLQAAGVHGLEDSSEVIFIGGEACSPSSLGLVINEEVDSRQVTELLTHMKASLLCYSVQEPRGQEHFDSDHNSESDRETAHVYLLRLSL